MDGSHLNQMPKTEDETIVSKQVRTRYGVYVIREATPADKEAVLKIREEFYGGLDFLPEFYDKLVSPTNGKAFLAQFEDKIVWFTSTMLIDNGQNCYVKGNRISEELEGKDVFLSFAKPVSEWALSKGALKCVATNTNHVRMASKSIMNMHYLIYLTQQENILLPWEDLETSHQVLQIPFDKLLTYFRSNDVSSYLFPHERIMVDVVPYKLMESNIALMNDYSGDHTKAYSDVRLDNGVAMGMLSFGTLFRAQKVSYVYGIELYGSDVNSVQRHIVRHLSELQQKANGSVCVFLFVQDDFPQQVADDICKKYGMKRENYPGTDYNQWNFQQEIVVERDLKL